MPVFLAALKGLWVIAAPLLMHVAIALGIGIISYTGASALFDVAFDEIASGLGSASGITRQALSLVRVDDAISVIMSAITTRLTMQGLSAAGAIKKIYWTGGSPIVLN